MKLSEQIRKYPVGEVIEVKPSAMGLVRYHARNFRQYKSSRNLKTGKQQVLLGKFL